ncbi:class I SAM-dependent methyltransferase [Hymenobacter qilianensis]|uniref:class I SAM-dependent methyltransferase n=1 Tax=Hymenobacter qilianensis TaxID=1385715 RepID=UPI0021D1A47C|nr:class I SAM-dependent methyltransferase [Hymenobacter qilianensis]
MDYGCGTGHFLAACKSNGWQVAGVEPNARAREEAARRVGQPIGAEDLGAFLPSRSMPLRSGMCSNTYMSWLVL